MALGVIMNNLNEISKSVYDNLIQWFHHFKTHEVTDLVELVNKSEALVIAAESLSEERCKQFIDSFAYDLHDFYAQYKSEVKHSLYLKLMQENFWRTLADITDKSQVEWVELQEDIVHRGEYQKGDVIGFGVLICKHCKDKLIVTHLTQVDECLLCGGQHFHREMLNA